MVDSRVKIYNIVQNQLPGFVKESYPLFSDFLKQYYISIENKSGTLDILQNIDKYIKIDELTNLEESTTTSSPISFSDDVIQVTSTNGFPDTYGLLKIDDEIITYTGITTNTFTGCVRGFSGITTYSTPSTSDYLTFEGSQANEHDSGSLVQNLSVLFLKEFLKKVKTQITPGFEGREFDGNVDERIFLKQSKDFYSSKGTDRSFKILFRALFGEEVDVIRPSDYLFKPSDAQYRITKDLVVEAIEGDPFTLLNRTLFQDANDLSGKAYGSINNVQRLQRDDNNYYVISLDYGSNRDIDVQGSIFGEFIVHPTTKLLSGVSIGASILDVDSTVGFGTSGSLTTDLENGTTLNITYGSRSYNQFYECSGITQAIPQGNLLKYDSYAYGYSGITTDNIVKLRITGVLSDLNILGDDYLYQKDKEIIIKSLGATLTDIKSNNWIFNIPVSYDVESVNIISSSSFTYEILTYDENTLKIGDSVKVILTDGTERVGNVYALGSSSKKSFSIKGQGQLDPSKVDRVEKIVSRGSSINYPDVSKYTSNIQNVYVQTEEQPENLYVASSSIPSYFETPLNVKDRSITFSGTFNGIDLTLPNHGFYTGDSVVYVPSDPNNTLGFSKGIFFVRKVNDNVIRLSRSRSNLDSGSYVTFSGTVTNDKLEYYEFSGQSLSSQKLVRNVSLPIESDDVNETEHGPTGILINGVEILNYKSKNSVFYGPIESIDVLSPGVSYDVINPPNLTITDSIGSGAGGYCEVEGSLFRVDVIDGGFDYVDTPIIKLVGGSGSGALVKPNMINVPHSVPFNSFAVAGLVDLTNNIIGFSTYHKFRDSEQVIYRTGGQTAISGLTTDSTYYVSVQDEYRIKLHKNYEDSSAGINTITISSFGNGVQRFESLFTKKKIGSIVVENSGSGYKNRKTTISSSGINTNSNTINITDHRYSSGEIITYTAPSNPIGGLLETSYYVVKIDENSFSLTPVGVGSTAKDFYFRTNQIVDLTSAGSGIHTFNYEPISINIIGKTGVSTVSGQNFQAILNPVVRGEIKSVYLNNNGVSYGSSEIINYNRQPSFNLTSGSGAEVLPIVSNGKIEEVLVVSPGSGYNSVPDLSVSGIGTGAVLTPVIAENGTLSEVKVINGGVGFSTEGTFVSVNSSGYGGEFYSNPKVWNVNLVERLFQTNLITDDDGVVYEGLNEDYGLEYTHTYAPRKLRQTVFGSKFVNGQIVYEPDLKLINNVEQNSTSHSPIIGWAYDGNPIYGPYGYDTPSGGNIRAMVSGYEKVLSDGRPNLSTYPEGFFVNDYVFTGKGDLDQYNGRFCITPDYPNGVYAYFATINNGPVESSGVFKNYKKPTFPYFIGNEYKSLPNSFNFDRYSNQDYINPSERGWLRNTGPYNLTKKNSYYDYIFNPNKVKKQKSIINYTSKSGIGSIGISTGGDGYSVFDSVVFDNSKTLGVGAVAEVDSIKGKQISSITSYRQIIDNIEFESGTGSGNFTGIATEPHNLKNLELISIAGLTTTSLLVQNGSYNIGINSHTLILNENVSGVSTTGIVTYFSVLGSFSDLNIRTDDIYRINSEKIKILNLDSSSSRIRVLRQYDGSVGQGHTISNVLYEDPRKFTFAVGVNTGYSFITNKKIYFDPSESVGLGTISGVGIGTTLYFANPGVGITQIFIPSKSIYIPDHNLQTGTEIIYSSGGGSPVSISTDGLTSTSLTEGQKLYVAKISNNLIGVSTDKVGLGNSGSFVGINSSILVDTVFFTGIGTGVVHSFKTNYTDVLSGKLVKKKVTVSTASTHGLAVDDFVDISVTSGLTTNVVVNYNDTLNKVVINPLTFTSGDVNIIDNTITIKDHKLKTGQKVLHTSSLPAGGLETNREYYIVVFDDDRIKLSETFYNSNLNVPIVVDITTQSSGTISLINPKIEITVGQKIYFDLSDSSLSYFDSSINYSAFTFDIFTDKNFKNKFISSGKNQTFEVIKNGRVGIDTTAYLELSVNDNLPQVLYYGLLPVSDSNLPDSKSNLIVDSENISNNNIIDIVNSEYTGRHNIIGITSLSFDFDIDSVPEVDSYLSSEATLEYTTSSPNAIGAINGITVRSSGSGYEVLPGISSVSSDFGSGAILNLYGKNIGKIVNSDIVDIGFEYPTDTTLRPVAKCPTILKIIPLSSFERIGISSNGVNYVISPDLTVIDGSTRKVVDDVILEYDLGDSEVKIIKNTKGINDVDPIILPTNNSNGVGISTIFYNSANGDVVVGLNVGFSTLSSFPFEIGDRVLIENVSVGINSTAKGYNSENYNYQLFTINGVDPNIGGVGATVSYNISQYLSGSEIPGLFDPLRSFGRIIPEKHFPIFDIQLTKNDFIVGEKVDSDNLTGTVEAYDSRNEYLTVSTTDDFTLQSLIKGRSTKTQGIIVEINSPYSEYSISSSSIVKNGWRLNTGFLNNEIQRLHDNDYYQYFSYAIKSKVEFVDWDNPVSNLNHTAGFKKFSDLIVESIDDTGTAGISTSQDNGDFSGLSDFISVIDLECVNDFDIATENTYTISNNIISSEIEFNSVDIQDYFESIGNRVLILDDVSDLFNSNPRPTRFSIVDRFLLNNFNYRKLFTYIRDKRFTDERQTSIVSLLHDGVNAYINQYANVSTSYDMGSFDFSIDGSEGTILFYPTRYSINDFDISILSHDIKNSFAGIGTTSFGKSIYVNTSRSIASSGLSTSQTIVSIGTTYRSSKILVEISGASSYHEVDEITVIHNGTDVEFIDYGQLTSEFGSFSSLGIGTYSAYISGSNLNIDIHPYSALTQNYTIDTLQISSGTGAGSTTTSVVQLNSIDVGSGYTSISSSGSPVENTILSVNSIIDTTRKTRGLYVVASVEDLTNSQYQVSELMICASSTEAFITEYGNLETSSGIGTFGADIVGNNLELYFTPIPSANVEVRFYYSSLSEVDPELLPNFIDLNNGIIDVSYGTYEGTDRSIRRDFNITHRGNNVFRRVFDGSDSAIVNITNDSIRIPNHFFVTGEEIVYNTEGSSTPIGIATTTIAGVGTTTLLPSQLYVVKLNDLDIKVAASASEALSNIPNTLDLTSVGIGTNHTFTSKKQNQRVLISIDNMIQSPVVSSAVTNTLLADFRTTENTAFFTGITSFFGGDLIKINDEIMRIESVGFGSDLAVLVQRPWMGTGISSHSAGDVITKISGNYNIVGNTLNFSEAPYGPIPLGLPTNDPDERDYTGITTHSTFSGRSFMRSGIAGGIEETYTKNYLFDDISNQFNGITTQFNLKSEGNDVSGISTGNGIILIKDIFQGPQRIGAVDILGDYSLDESSGITTLSFTGYGVSTSYDVNNSSIPVGGQIISVGSTNGFAYQPLVSAAGTAIISIAGTVQSISIGNSGSGYRSGIQTVNVGVATTSLGNYDIEFIGTATVNDGRVVSVAITNPGTGYSFTEPPFVLFDSPLSYSNIPLIYSSSSPLGGIGTEAKIDIVVGQGSSVIDFNIRNTGFGYGQGDILTVEIGGSTGIPTDTTKTFGEFQITVDKTYNMEFSGWTVGDFQVLDEIQGLFDDETVKFPIKLENIRYSIQAKPGSNIDLKSTLLIFINDILQVPGEAYKFEGGSVIEFTEAPKRGDTCKILFYKGTGDVDVASFDILESVKVGDTLQLNDYDNILYQQNKRLVTSIDSVDLVTTNSYAKPGINRDETYERPVTWCRQRDDKIINGQQVSKDRIIYEPLINPSSYLIQPVSTTDTEVYVDNIFTFFNPSNENAGSEYQGKIRIIEQNQLVSASATAFVSVAGSVTSIILDNGGVGYSTNPIVTISNPIYSSGVLTYPQGSVQSISYSEYGAGSMSLLFNGDADDTFFTIPLPTTLDFLGNNYSEFYLGSNGYITFGAGERVYAGLDFNTPNRPKIHIYPGDRRVTKVYTRNLSDSVRVRVEGYNYGSSQSISPYVYEFEVNCNGYVDINYINNYDNPQGGIGDGVNPFIGTWSTSDTISYRIYTENYTLSGISTATATASITSGIVTSINVIDVGTGYTNTSPPSVLIETPSFKYEDIENVTYFGDFGIISGISTISVGVASTGIIFDLFINLDSFLRDTNIVGTAVTISGISTGDYFIVRNSNVGNGVTSLYSNGTNLGIGTEYLDNVYEVSSVSIAQTDVVGCGNTYVAKVTVSISDYNGLTGIGYSNFFGEYSWGKIIVSERTNPQSFEWYNNGLLGVSTSPILLRKNSLKYINYT